MRAMDTNCHGRFWPTFLPIKNLQGNYKKMSKKVGRKAAMTYNRMTAILSTVLNIDYTTTFAPKLQKSE